MMTGKLRFVHDWRDCWRWASVRLAAITGVVSGVLTAQPELLLGLIGFLPAGPLRLVLALAVAAIVFVVPTVTRLLRKHEEQADG